MNEYLKLIVENIGNILLGLSGLIAIGAWKNKIRHKQNSKFNRRVLILLDFLRELENDAEVKIPIAIMFTSVLTYKQVENKRIAYLRYKNICNNCLIGINESFYSLDNRARRKVYPEIESIKNETSDMISSLHFCLTNTNIDAAKIHLDELRDKLKKLKKTVELTLDKI